ncbi:MAG TPA: YHS domain-containing protein [Candidatus Nanopelagicales bacterium]|nr:YHS domain-containing protein [Candidatus Krumholzibacteria bacterium]HRV67131.1 YHS domain-containing protein [Candidatus Nanopelagicales bacterium]
MRKEHQPTSHKDPVCGMEVSRESAAAEVEHGGTRYFFCSDMCKSRFLESPQQYLDSGGAS